MTRPAALATEREKVAQLLAAIAGLVHTIENRCTPAEETAAYLDVLRVAEHVSH